MHSFKVNSLGHTLPCRKARLTGRLRTSDWSVPTLSRGQIAYAASDAVLVHRLWAIQHKELQRTGRLDAYELQRRVIPAVAAMERRGLLLDRAEHARQVDAWTTELGEARRSYTADTGSPPPTRPSEVREWLRRILPPHQLASWPCTANSGDLSTESANLKRLVGLPGTLPVLRMLAHAKLLSTFGPKLMQYINPATGRIHPSFHIAATKAGRFSCTRPNLQQVPSRRAPEFRRCIVAAPGNVLVGCDWSQVELRAAAWISGDPALTYIYQQGLDLHAEMASVIAGVPIEQITKEQRQAAKAISFGSVYGIGPKALAQNAFADYDVTMTEREARDALARFFTRFAILDQWRRQQANQCIAQGFIRIGAGRVVQAAWEPGRKLTFPQCCNLPVRGICADAMLRVCSGKQDGCERQSG
jgi:DNA polymerase-1